ncbi:MAG: signal peptidase II [Candidatus Saganbacteria bacterium]|nr:signal peptidase II [Candidatus Saganbacteria bacterium]
MIIFYPLVGLVFCLDQLSKSFFSSFLSAGQSIPVINNLFHFTLVQNRGAAFGIFQGQAKPLLVIAICVALVVLFFHYRIKRDNYLVQTGLAFILGGSLGNICDRLRFAYVVDFLDFRFWPVFNVADTFINIGVLLLVVYLFRSSKS